MTKTPTVAMSDFDKSFTIESDASKEGIGVVLSQEGKPIAYMSRAIGVSKRSWSTYAKEMLAIVQARQTWRSYAKEILYLLAIVQARGNYLLEHKFFIVTDHKGLKHLMEQRIAHYT